MAHLIIFFVSQFIVAVILVFAASRRIKRLKEELDVERTRSRAMRFYLMKKFESEELERKKQEEELERMKKAE